MLEINSKNNELKMVNEKILGIEKELSNIKCNFNVPFMYGTSEFIICKTLIK